MSDERILDELRKVAKDDAARTGELVTRAREGTAADDDEEAFVRAALARADDERLLGLLGASAAPRPSSKPMSASPRPLQAEPVLAARSRVPGRTMALLAGGTASVVALAAAVLFLVRVPDAALPAYEADVTGTDALARSSAGTSTEVSPGARIVFIARPATPIGAPVYARAFGGCGKESPLAVRVTVAPTGATRIEGSSETLFGASSRGACTLVLAMGTSTVPDSPEGAAGVRLVRARFDVK